MYICGDLHLRAHAMDRQTCTNTRTIALYSYIMYNSGSNLDIAADVTTVLFENLPLQLTQFLCTQLLGVTRELVYLHCGDVRRELLRSRQIFEMKISFFRWTIFFLRHAEWVNIFLNLVFMYANNSKKLLWSGC